MKKKLLLFVLILTFLMCISNASLASSISESFTSALYYRFANGTVNVSSQTIATATHSYLLKNNTQGKYSGATNQGTTCSKGSRTSSVTITSKPNFTASVTNEGNKITVTFSGGRVTIVFQDTYHIDANGTQTLGPESGTQYSSFSQSKTHSK